MILRQTYLDRIRPFIGADVIKVLVGVRRSGKSTLLRMLQSELLANGVPPENIIAMNFESAQFRRVTDGDALVDIVAGLAPRSGRIHIFLDEAQEVPGWEKAVRSFLVDYDADIYVTGSNAHVLSSDLATHITGRYVSFDVYPFSFAEFYAALLELGPIEREVAFSTYLIQGGFPFQTQLNFDEELTMQYLRDLYGTILFQDVVQHAGVREPEQLERITRFAMAEEGHLMSPNKVANYLKNEGRRVARDTVAHYLRAAEAAFLLYRAQREDVVGKRLLQFNDKYYVVDQGLRQANGLDSRANIDQVLEGIVFMELRRRGYKVTVGAVGEREVDFIARRKTETEYYQVTYLLASEKVRDREYGSLLAINDNYPKFVLSLDPVASDLEGIRGLNLIDWLLGA